VDYLSTFESLDGFYTDEACRRVGEYCKEIGMDVGGFVFQSAMWNDPTRRRKRRSSITSSLRAQAAKTVCASIVTCIIPGPFGAKPTGRTLLLPKSARPICLKAIAGRRIGTLFASMIAPRAISPAITA
jgi:hypothetical protein